MFQTSLEYYSGNVPGGIFLLVALLAITWFVLWFVFHFSKLLRLDRLILVGGICSLSICIGYVYFWFKYPPPHERQRILILADINPELSDSSSQTYLYQTYLYEFLKSKIDLSRFLVYKPDSYLAIANWDSLKYSSYQTKLTKFMRASYVIYIRNETSSELITGDLLVQNQSAGFDTTRDVLSGTPEEIELQPGVLDIFSIDSQYSKIFTSRWPQQIQKTWAKGKLAYISKDLISAQHSYLQCLQVDEGFYTAQIELAQLDVDSAQILQADGGYYQNHLSRATQYLYQLRDQNIINGDVERIWGEHAILLENFVVAEQKLKESHKLDRFSDRLYLDLTQLHPSRYQNLKFLNEESLIRQALFVNPASFQAIIQYSDFLNLNSRYEESENILMQFLEVFPDQFDVLLTLGKFYVSRQNYVDAHAIFSKMLSGNYFNKMPVKFNLGVVYFHQEDFVNAKKIFTRIATQNMNPDAFLYLAYISEKEEDIEQSIEYLRKRIRYNRGPNDRYKEEARKRLVMLLKKQGELPN